MIIQFHKNDNLCQQTGNILSEIQCLINQLLRTSEQPATTFLKKTTKVAEIPSSWDVKHANRNTIKFCTWICNKSFWLSLATDGNKKNKHSNYQLLIKIHERSSYKMLLVLSYLPKATEIIKFSYLQSIWDRRKVLSL